MPKRKRMSKPSRIDFVREARAGLIPASDDIADEKRSRLNSTARIIRAAKPQLGTAKRVSDECAITSILADLRHYCDYNGLSFCKLDRNAGAQYLEDAADFRSIPSAVVDAAARQFRSAGLKGT
jgi:hypothetical protein